MCPRQETVEDALLTGYNDVPYTSAPDPARHPERLATLGTLLGLDVAPLPTCRVLELACGDGANLVPIASTLPGATFVGFDFAAAPIARAQRMVSELRLANVHAVQLHLREVPGDFGTFDYIIAHGLYSWIPADVRAHVMPLIARLLAPNGVALVSYNAMPGCHMRGSQDRRKKGPYGTFRTVPGHTRGSARRNPATLTYVYDSNKGRRIRPDAWCTRAHVRETWACM